MGAFEKFRRNGWAWVPGVYFCEGLPMAVGSVVAVTLFAAFGMPNAQMTFWTSMIALPWSLKFLWAPYLDLHGTKRAWMLGMEVLLALSLAALAVAVGASLPFGVLIGMFLLLALLSATHDVAADGYYLLALSAHDQAVCSGLRNIFYKCAMLAGQGGIVVLCGILLERGRSPAQAWCIAFLGGAALLGVLALWHFRATPRVERARCVTTPLGRGFREAFAGFFARNGAVSAILFLLFFRFAEAQLAKLGTPFLLASPEAGGLGLSLKTQGWISGTLGAMAFLAGSFLAGLAVGRWGFGKCLWPMAFALNAPDVFYLLLALWRPELPVTAALVGLEQFGYGLGYMAHVLFMVQYSDRGGEFKTSHFALMTGVTILGMTVAGMFSGSIQEWLFARFANGYAPFFLWVCVCTIPSFLVTALIRRQINPDFGRKPR